MRKNKLKVCFVESSFGQKSSVNISHSTIPHCVLFPNWCQNVVCLRKTNTNSFILSQAYINISPNYYFPRKSLSKYLMDTIDFNKHVHDIDILINDKWKKYAKNQFVDRKFSDEAYIIKL